MTTRRISAIRWLQGMLARRGIELRRARHALDAMRRLPGGAPRTVLDIGANAGQFARRARIALPAATLHSFEPLPGPFAELQSWAAGESGVHCHSVALGDTSGTQAIHTGNYTASSSLLAPAPRLADSLPQVMPDRVLEITVMRLDDWAQSVRLESPMLVKLDVQGFEKGVIGGGRQTVGGAAAILVELSFVRLYQGQPLIGEMMALLGELDFQLVDIYDVVPDPVTGLGFQCDGLFLSRHLLGDMS